MLEYESKEIFSEFGIPLVNNMLILKGEDIEEKVKDFSFPALVKSQIAIGSRKKAGLIKIAKSANEAISLCDEYFKRNVAGFEVEAILIEELVTVEQEYYCSVALDASGRQFYLIASKEGGIDIEEVSKTTPDAILKESFSFQDGISEELANGIANQLGLSGKQNAEASQIFMKLWDIAFKLEAQLVEINPLVMTPSGLFAVDGKMILDDDAAFRQPIVQRLQDRKLSDLEKLAKDAGFSFVELSGNIGILANGAGLTMALLDILSELGLKPANFLDVGGGASKERVYKALELIFKLKPSAVLVNIFGGITRCDIVAQAIIQALSDFSNAPPMIIRLTGTNEKEGIVLLKQANIEAFQDIMSAVKKVKEVLSE
ncbi:MAG: ADP-forming succinate--CoA ligase subunit beta [Candidatus Lokiarchaeota archaeon]|nr:ADP-forming succinate--CoA ligase subunit beta [Candidatus Lokiarchaeota archaeon]